MVESEDPNSTAEQADFVERSRCIACDSDQLQTLDRRSFAEEPHREMLLYGIWGTSPFPHLKHCEWELVRCQVCSQIFHKRILSPAWDERRHKEWMNKDAIERFEERRGRNAPRAIFDETRGEVDRLLRLEKMTRSLRRPEEAMRLLDFGCGWGRLVSLASLFGFDAAGIDRSTARRGRHQEGLGRIYPSIEDFLSENSRPVHVVTLMQVLEHLTSPAPILRELHRLMIPSGILLLEVPDAGNVRGIKTTEDLVIDGLDHLNAFSPATLTGIAERAGFTRVSPAIAHVTSDVGRVAKREAGRLLRHVRRATTKQYFRRV